MNPDLSQRALLAPTIGVLDCSTAGSARTANDFLSGLFNNIVEQTKAVANRLKVDSRPGRIIYVGEANLEPAWVIAAKDQGWVASSVAPAPGRPLLSDLTFEVDIDPQAIVASNAEIVVLLGIDEPSQASGLLANLIPDALIVTYNDHSQSRFWILDNAKTQERAAADFRRAVQHLVTGSRDGKTDYEMDLTDVVKPGFSIGGIFPTMIKLLSRRDHRVTFRFKAPSEVAQGSLEFIDLTILRSSTQAFLVEARNRILPIFVAADETAIYYGDLYRTFILLGLFCTLIAFLALIFAHFHTSWSRVFRGVEIPALILILVTVFVSRSFAYHRKWLIQRMIAELLRPSQYLLPLWLRTSRGFAFPQRSKYLSFAIAHQRLVIRKASPLALHLDQEYLDEMRSAILDLLLNQIDWHKRNAEKHLICHKWFVWANVGFFVLLLVAGVLSWLPAVGSDLSFVAASICTLCMSISAACIHYFSFDHITERSELALRRYQILYNHIATLGPHVVYADLKLWIQSISDVMADEQLDWFLQTSRLHLVF